MNKKMSISEAEAYRKEMQRVADDFHAIFPEVDDELDCNRTSCIYNVLGFCQTKDYGCRIKLDREEDGNADQNEDDRIDY